MKNVIITCLLALPVLFVSAAPLDVSEFSRRSGVHVVKRPVANPVHSCTCNGRHYSDVFNQSHDPSAFYNHEGISFAHCPNPMTRWMINGHDLDRAVFSGTHFCGCITHEGAATRNGFVACH